MGLLDYCRNLAQEMRDIWRDPECRRQLVELSAKILISYLSLKWTMKLMKEAVQMADHGDNKSIANILMALGFPKILARRVTRNLSSHEKKVLQSCAVIAGTSKKNRLLNPRCPFCKLLRA